MIRRLLFHASWIVFGAFASCGGGSGAEIQRPHVILIVIDTLRADVLHPGPYMADRPHIAELARDGTVYTKAFSHAPLTLPSHTSLFSSRLPLETGVLANGNTVPDTLPLLPEHLSKLGYESRAVVSMGTLLSKGDGLKRGFKSFNSDFLCMADGADTAERLKEDLDQWEQDKRLFLFAHYSDPHAPYRAHGTADTKANILVNGEVVDTLVTSDARAWERTFSLPAGTHRIEMDSPKKFRILSARVAGEGGVIEPTWLAGKRLGRQKNAVMEVKLDKPDDLEVTLWLTDVVNTRTKRDRYLLETTYADSFVGDLVAELKARGIYDDSLIILHSDHGESLGEHDYTGHAKALTDVTIRVPLVVKPPKGHPLGEGLGHQSLDLVSLVDVVPTILDFCGAPDLPGQRGNSLVGERKEVVHVAETHTPDSDRDLVCLRDQKYKMIYAWESDTYTMYDMESDVDELFDVYAERSGERPEWPERLRVLAAQAEAARKGTATDAETQAMLEALGYAGGED